MTRLLALVAIVAATTAAAPTEARASHYRLGESGIVTKVELDALAKAGVKTTKSLLENTRPIKSRRALAAKTAIPIRRITALAMQCDLMQIRGIGPTMVRLLQLSGVMHTQSLKKRDAGTLRSKLVSVNARYKVSESVPDATTLGSWIARARGVKKKLEGVK